MGTAGKIRLSERDWHRIAGTSPKECWICDRLVKAVRKDSRGLFIDRDWVFEQSFEEHLAQLIGREKVFGDMATRAGDELKKMVGGG